MRRQRALDVTIALVALALTLGLHAAGGIGPGYQPRRHFDVLGVVLAVLSTLPLAVWRRAPLGVYAATIVPNAVMRALGYPGGPPFGPAIALYFLASTRPATRRTVAVVVALFVAHFSAFGLARGEFPTIELLLGTSFWLAIWIVGDRVRLRREQMTELEERARRAEEEAERERRLAAAEERMRIARDLHDSAGHAINVILVQAGAARLLQEQDPKAARAALDTIEDVARQTLGEIDQLVRALREDDSGEEVEPPPGLAALETLAQHHRRTGLGVTVRVHGPSRTLPPAVDRAAYRILQEALTNAARHGIGAAEIDLAFGADALEVIVSNPARRGGDATEGGGHGIVGMRERAALLGGSVEVGSSNGLFRVRASLPYHGDESG